VTVEQHVGPWKLAPPHCSYRLAQRLAEAADAASNRQQKVRMARVLAMICKQHRLYFISAAHEESIQLLMVLVHIYGNAHSASGLELDGVVDVNRCIRCSRRE
jgi:hypothetical protein